MLHGALHAWRTALSACPHVVRAAHLRCAVRGLAGRQHPALLPPPPRTHSAPPAPPPPPTPILNHPLPPHPPLPGNAPRPHHTHTHEPGIPNSGKSEFLDALLVNLAEEYGWAFAMASLEKTPHQHAKQIIEKRMRMPLRG